MHLVNEEVSQDYAMSVLKLGKEQNVRGADLYVGLVKAIQLNAIQFFIGKDMDEIEILLAGIKADLTTAGVI